MATTKLPAITSGVVTVATVDYEITSASATLNQEEISYTPMAASGPVWEETIPGGKLSLEGSIEFAWDTSLSGTGDYPAPFSVSEVAVVFNIGAKSLSFDAVIGSLSIEKSDSGVVTCSCDYKSAGEVTFTSS